MSDWVIHTNLLTKKYGKQYSVKNVNLQVARGGVYGFLGHNGAGKTTTIKMLLGMVKPTSGNIRIFDRDIKRDRKTILQKIGSLVESPTYYGHLTGHENLRVITRVLGLSEKHIQDALSLVRLTKDAHRLVKNYSLGMKQRLGIAAALIGNPELLILDEPTNGLDPAGILEIRDLITRLPKERGVTILISSHLLSEIEQTANYIGIINKGELVYQDTLDALKKQVKGRIELEVNQPMEAAHYLNRFGWHAYIDEDKLCLDVTDKEKVAQTIRSLVQGSFDIFDFKRMEPSLENIFIALTGKEQSL
jgi:ABC-2 type transport system ATP-binding protein